MKTTVKKLSDTCVEMKVILDATDLSPSHHKALEQLSKELQVKGFRKGKVPPAIAKKFLPENDINAKAIDIAIHTTINTAFSKHQLTPIATPRVDLHKYVPQETAEYIVIVDILPEIKLCNYRQLGVKPPQTKITEKDIQAILKNLAQSHATTSPVKRSAQNSDEVIIDFTGKKAGKPFDGGSAKDYKLILGSKTFIPGFEEGIIGHQTGDKFNLDLTFPKNYPTSNLAGVKVTFEILLKQVNSVTLPPIDDHLAKQHTPFKTLIELKTDIKQYLTTQQNHQLTQQYQDELIKTLVAKSKIPTPETLITDQFNLLKNDLTQNANSKKLSLEQYLKQKNTNLKDWEKTARQVAKNRVQASLALQTIAQNEHITVSDSAVEAKIQELKKTYQKSPEALNNLQNPAIKADITHRLIIEKTLDFLDQVNRSQKPQPKSS